MKYAGILAVTLSFALVGCSSEPEKQNTRKAARATQEAAPAPAQKREIRDLFNLKSKVLEYTYNPIGKRDPFKEFSGSTTVVTLDRGGPLTSYDIDQMKLVAVIWGISEPRALVQLPDQKSYIIKRNSPVGRHFGRVARVLPDAVVVEEEFRGPLGDLQIKETKLILNEDNQAQANAPAALPGGGKK